MLVCHRLFMKIKTLAAILMATLTVLEAQQCYLKHFKNVTDGKLHPRYFQLAKILTNFLWSLTGLFSGQLCLN